MQAMALGQRGTLRLGGGSYMGMQIPVADPRGEGGTEAGRYQSMHHVERRHAAAAGQSVAVEDIAGLFGLEAGKVLDQRRSVFPMDGEAVICQQAGSGQQVRSA
ncbi:hypothetical protein D3C87_1498090 [compost metagenome]